MTRSLKKLIGMSTDPIQIEVERGQIRRFAKAVGEENLIHHEVERAQQAGFRDLAAPPSFVMALYDLDEFYDELGLNRQTLMHAEEEFEYFHPLCAGDSLELQHSVVDAYETKSPNGTLTFIVLESKGTDGRKRLVVKGRRVLVDMSV